MLRIGARAPALEAVWGMMKKTPANRRIFKAREFAVLVLRDLRRFTLLPLLPGAA